MTYPRNSPSAERWLVALPLVVIVGLVFVCLLGTFVAVMLGSST